MWKIKTKEELNVGDMTKAMMEKQALPIGREEFEKWSDRIIDKANVTAEKESLKFSLAAMLMQLSPTEAFREDAYFILSLRKAAVNQTAHSMMVELKELQEEKKKLAEATAPNHGVVDAAVLAEKGI